MNAEQYNQVIQTAEAQIPELLRHMEASVMEACAASLTESQERDTKPKASIGLTITIFLHTAPPQVDIKAAVSVRHTESTGPMELDDPNQPKLL